MSKSFESFLLKKKYNINSSLSDDIKCNFDKQSMYKKVYNKLKHDQKIIQYISIIELYDLLQSLEKYHITCEFQKYTRIQIVLGRINLITMKNKKLDDDSNNLKLYFYRTGYLYWMQYMLYYVIRLWNKIISLCELL